MKGRRKAIRARIWRAMSDEKRPYMDIVQELEAARKFRASVDACQCKNKPCESIQVGSICDSDPEFFD